MSNDALTSPDIDAFIDAMWMEKGLSSNTLAAYRRDLSQFHEWLLQQGEAGIVDATRQSLQAYLVRACSAASRLAPRRDSCPVPGVSITTCCERGVFLLTRPWI